jgi:hypothetical protein
MDQLCVFKIAPFLHDGGCALHANKSMTRTEYQQRRRRLRWERVLTGVVLGALWLLAVTGVASERIAGGGHRWVVAGVAVVGLMGAYGLWAIWIARAVKKHDLLCPNCCRSLAGKPTSNDEAFHCAHCGISIFSNS